VVPPYEVHPWRATVAGESPRWKAQPIGVVEAPSSRPQPSPRPDEARRRERGKKVGRPPGRSGRPFAGDRTVPCRDR
jgi:hypothetical protein